MQTYDTIDLTDEGDGRLFEIKILSTRETRIARYHSRQLAGRLLRFPVFADPDQPDDYLRCVHAGWGAQAIRRL